MPKGVQGSGPNPKRFPAKRGAKKRLVISDQHKAIVTEYFQNGFNKTKALESIGIPHKKANSDAYRIFSREEVMNEVEARHAAARKRSDRGADRLIEEYEKIAYVNLGKYGKINAETGYWDLDLRVVPEEERENLMAAISQFKVETTTDREGDITVKFEIKPWDKVRAMEGLARHYGLFNDKLEVAGEVSLIERIQEGRKRASAEGEGEAEDEGK